MQKSKTKRQRKTSKRTKIIATLGPASESPQRIKSLLKRGVNVFRVNFSHGEHTAHKKTIQQVRKVTKENNSHAAILGDLCGPKIRTGIFKNDGIQINNGDHVTVTTRDVLGDIGLIPSQYTKLHKDMQVGQRILLDDGKMELCVNAIDKTELSCTVTYGGFLSNKKGMNLPDTKVSSPSLTKKDKADLQLAIECDVDFIALSFVRNAKDIFALKKEMQKANADIPIIAKIERPEAIDNIDEILQATYGIMIARGDLGIEIAAEKVPLLQNRLITQARLKHKPVIVATQMMESMIENSRPTRAEVGDVANAALQGADAVMLSGETSVGKYPLKTVEYMDKIVREVEQSHDKKNGILENTSKQNEYKGLRQSMSHAAMGLAEDLLLQALIVPTKSGTTAQILSSYRPSSIVLGVSHSINTCRKLSLHWGVLPFHIETEKFKNWRELTAEINRHCPLIKSGDRVLIVSGFKVDNTKSEPVLKLLFV